MFIAIGRDRSLHDHWQDLKKAILVLLAPIIPPSMGKDLPVTITKKWVTLQINLLADELGQVKQTAQSDMQRYIGTRNGVSWRQPAPRCFMHS
jgi:hypothetical protein